MPRGVAADSEWEDIGQTGDEKEIMGMCVYNGTFRLRTTHLRRIIVLDLVPATACDVVSA